MLKNNFVMKFVNKLCLCYEIRKLFIFFIMKFVINQYFCR